MRLNPLLPPLRPRLRAAACGLLLALGQAQAADCAALAKVATADARVDRAAHVAAPATVEGVAVSAAFCRVQGTARPSADSLIRFEVWLPLDGARWSGRLKVNGTGGFAGAVPYARLAQDVADGFVGAGSNMGHDGGESPAWTLNRPEKVKDWGLRAHQSVTLAARTLALAHFGRPVRHAYFEGCSNGGRQALLMAQQYPQLFDGIVAGAPSNFYPDLLMWLLWSGQALMPSAPPAAPVVSAEQRQHVTRRVLQACDAADGLADGQITDPRACQFDIRTLGPQGDGSLSAPALAAFQAMYAGTTSPAGERRYTGARPGSEADWDPLFADRGGYGAFIGHAVYGRSSPPFDWRRELDFGPVHDHVKATLSPVTAAPSPDLRAFRQRGGKIIQYHGWNDAVVPPDGSIGYLHALAQFERLQALPAAEFERRIDRLNLRQLAATSARFGPRVRDFHRLFMLPAVGHCGGSSGPGAIGGGAPEPPPALRDAEHHVVQALIRWVEQGVAPQRLVASRVDAEGRLLRQRPLCPYPAQARYLGRGSVDAAQSFRCVTPTQPVVDAGDLVHARHALRQRAR